ncbi:MAG: GNAT family N-acetyltransferase [Bacteroidales bacterium]|nr:GNAT family N-acetyltransferase [Bacteroidales bacterium]
MTERKIYGVKLNIAESPFHSHVPFNDIICSNIDTAKNTLPLFIKYLKQSFKYSWDVLALNNFTDESVLGGILNKKSLFINEIFQKVGYSDYLLVQPYDDFLRSISKNFRNNLKKSKNKLNKAGEILFESTTDHRVLIDYFNFFLNVESSGWKGECGTKTAIKFHPEITAFYESLIDGLAPLKKCEISLLRINSIPIAALFCLLCNGTAYLLKIGYDESFAHLSPGNMLMANTLERYGEDCNIDVVNFITDASWLKSWKPKKHNIFLYYFFNKTFKGIFVCFLLKMKSLLRPFYVRTKIFLKKSNELEFSKKSSGQS